MTGGGVRLIRHDNSDQEIKIYRPPGQYPGYQAMLLDDKEYATLRHLMIEQEEEDVALEREMMREDLHALLRAAGIMQPDGTMEPHYSELTCHELMQKAIVIAARDHELAWQHEQLQQ